MTLRIIIIGQKSMMGWVLLLLFAEIAVAQEATTEAVPVIVVTGSRSPRALADSVLPVQVKRQKDIEEAGARNAAEALATVSGLQVREELRGQSVTIQGLSGRHVLILIDGERPTGFTDGAFDLTRIPADQIERIEIVKGAASALYGSDAIGGVVNIITRAPRTGVNGHVTLTQDSNAARELSAILNAGNADTRVSMQASKQNGPSVDLDDARPDTNLSAYDLTRATLRLGHRVSSSFDLGLRTSVETHELSGVNVTGGGAVLDATSVTTTRTFGLEPVYTEPSGAEWRLKANRSRTNDTFREDQRLSAALDREEHAREDTREGSLIHARDINDHHHVTAGIDLLAQSATSDRLATKASERTRRGVFAQYEWAIGENRSVIFSPGIRMDDDSQFGEAYSPKLALRWNAAEGLILRTSYGKGFRAPDFKELFLRFENPQVGYRVEGNPTLAPEKSESFTAGAEWAVRSDMWLNLGLFQNNVHNLITTDVLTSEGPGTIVYSYVNAARARTRGVEVSARTRLAERWQLGAEYAFLEAKDLDLGRTLAGRAQHSGNAFIAYGNKDLGLTSRLECYAVGTRPFYTTAASGDVTQWAKPYRGVSLRIAKELSDTFEVFAGGRNLTDEFDILYHAVPRRSFFGGVKAGF